ncbi:hypothetical protein SAMN05428949_5340 [Chitinophaga sp. YR627]|nr:hypothetical protein SAMN05428949_5340 [Chitinophaga sp. YR627]
MLYAAHNILPVELFTFSPFPNREISLDIPLAPANSPPHHLNYIHFI